jgi:hypothetical protein
VTVAKAGHRSRSEYFPAIVSQKERGPLRYRNAERRFIALPRSVLKEHLRVHENNHSGFRQRSLDD